MKRLTLATLVSLFATVPAFAGGFVNGHITYPTSQRGLQFFVSSDAAISNKPACATANRFVFDPTTVNGKVMLATIMTAYAMGRTVTMLGDNTCNIWGDSEDLAVITINLS